MDVQHVSPVGQHGVDVDLLDVGLVGHGVLRHEQLADMLKWKGWPHTILIISFKSHLNVTIVCVDSDIFVINLVKSI